MKYTILGFSQAKLLELRLGMDEAMILRWFIDFQSTGKMRKVLMEGREWMWVSYAGVLEAIPIVGGSPKTISRRFDNLERAGVLEHTTFREGGVFSVYRICEQVYQTLIDDQEIEPPREAKEEVKEETKEEVKEEQIIDEGPLDKIVQPQTELSNHRTELSNRWTDLSEQKNLLLDSSIRFLEEPPLIPPREISTPPPPRRSKRFIRPTLEEVRAYCQERGNDVDAEKFIDFYESKGWKVGKSAMKDWKASIRTWEKPKNKKEGFREGRANSAWSGQKSGKISL